MTATRNASVTNTTMAANTINSPATIVVSHPVSAPGQSILAPIIHVADVVTPIASTVLRQIHRPMCDGCATQKP